MSGRKGSVGISPALQKTSRRQIARNPRFHPSSLPPVTEAGGGSSSKQDGNMLGPRPQAVVLYSTSFHGQYRRLPGDISAVRGILSGLGVAVDERDVFTDAASNQELRSLLAARHRAYSIPQLFVGSRLVGGADEVRKLHKTGELQKLLKGTPKPRQMSTRSSVIERIRQQVVVSAQAAFRAAPLRPAPHVTAPESSTRTGKMLLDLGHEDELEAAHDHEEAPTTQDVVRKSTSVSVWLGAMRPLLAKLDAMLGPPQGLSSWLPKGVKDRMHLLRDDVEEISTYLEDMLEAEEEPPLTARCWMKEARELSYDMEDYIDDASSVQRRDLVANNNGTTIHVRIPKSRLKWQKEIAAAAGTKKAFRVDVIRVPKKLNWYSHTLETVSKFRTRAQEAIGRYERYDLHRIVRTKFLQPVSSLPPLPCHEETPIVLPGGRMSEFINSYW